TMLRYKLIYFQIRGRGEVARQLFYLTGVPFQDVRISMDEWPAFKTKTPFGVLPVLEVDGQPIPQSFAIYRYLAKQFEFAGDSPFEALWVDTIADQHKEYFSQIKPAFFFEGSEEEKEQIMKHVAEPARDKYYPLLEKVTPDNGSNGHFVGASLTWVDLLIAEHVSILLSQSPQFLNNYPTVLSTVNEVLSTPKLKEWIDKRPYTAF
ncbi:hypothetical protein PENTCL1PPCAC_15468, partial [Pristionchus entomophagus]